MTKKIAPELGSLARAETLTAVRVLKGIMTQRNAQSTARVNAAIALLDRGWGKPARTHKMTGADGGPIEVIIRDLLKERDSRK